MAKPRVIGTLLVRDEEDIVIECIEHHLRHGIDGFIITDNNSEDSTLELVSKHPAALIVYKETANTYEQSKWVTRMARDAYDIKADWVVNIDADEFWYGPEYLENISNNTNEILISRIYDHIVEVPGLAYGTFKRSMLPY